MEREKEGKTESQRQREKVKHVKKESKRKLEREKEGMKNEQKSGRKKQSDEKRDRDSIEGKRWRVNGNNCILGQIVRALKKGVVESLR